MRLFAVPIRTFLLSNLGTRFLLRGKGCDTPRVTVEATLFCSVIYNVSWFSVKFQIQNFPLETIKISHNYHL
jgi:hypothetical protein